MRRETLEDLERVQRRLDQLQRGYVPHRPFPKQEQFVGLNVREALIGGGTGTGKSDALLMAVLRDVKLPGYRGLILRRTYAEARLPDAIMSRARSWLADTDAVWSEADSCARFPNGSVLQFGYCDSDAHVRRYKGGSYHCIGFEELTEWPDRWYLQIAFSRMRKLRTDKQTIRVLSNTNPDGIGQEWVRRRFGIPANTRIHEPIWSTPTRVYLPTLLDDNPALDAEDYDISLRELPPVRYQQLRWGVWVRDGSGLVYSGFNPDSVARPPACDHHVLGIDFGFTDSTAFAVLGWKTGERTVYVLESAAYPGLIPSAAAEKVRELEARYRFDRIVGDIGGLGKGYAEEARQRWGIPIEPAEKRNKRGYIELTNDALRRGELVLTPGNEALAKEWLELPWDKDRAAEAEGFSNHISDACLYSFRACLAFAESPPVTQAGTEEKMLSEHIERVMARRDADWWE